MEFQIKENKDAKETIDSLKNKLDILNTSFISLNTKLDILSTENCLLKKENEILHQNNKNTTSSSPNKTTDENTTAIANKPSEGIRDDTTATDMVVGMTGDEVEAVAREGAEKAGYIFDESVGMYYDQVSCCYYDAVRSNNNNY